MQRIRRPRLSPAATRRLLAAVLLSMVVHTYFVFGIRWRPLSPAPPAAMEIQARLIVSPPVMQPRTRHRDSLPEASPVAAIPALPFTFPTPASPVRTSEGASEPLSIVQQEAQVAAWPEAVPARASEVVPPIAEIPDLEFYPVGEIDVYPVLRRPVLPRWPADAAAGGMAAVLLMIDEFGEVRDVRLVDSQPDGSFDEAVLQAYARAQFTPAEKAGIAVRSRIVLRVDFLTESRVPAR